MKIGICGIACEKCPRMTARQCPNGDKGLHTKAEQILQDNELCLREI